MTTCVSGELQGKIVSENTPKYVIIRTSQISKEQIDVKVISQFLRGVGMLEDVSLQRWKTGRA